MKKNTLEDFIKKSQQIHNNKYDYSKVEYINNRTKVCIICPEHGEFWQTPHSHLSGCGCCKCKYDQSKQRLLLTTEDFINKAIQIHGDKYTYSKVNYIGAEEKVCIICPKHVEFLQRPSWHLSVYGCPKCYDERRGANLRDDLTTFISKAKQIHGDKYDYSKVKYINSRTEICIICPEHGEFWQTPHNHLKGQNCPLCAKEKRKTKELYNNQQKFIELSKQKFGNKFDYSKVNYENNRNKVTLICSKHGEISVIPYEHLSSQFGCKQCAVESVGKERINTYAHHFFHKANIIHNNKYNYDNSVYNGISQSIVINCPIHGDFEQIASYHLDGCGCPVCGCRLSKGENEIYEFIKSKKIEVIRNDRNIIKPLELDLYLPNSNIAIEYNGLIWHSEQYKYNPINYHLEKTEKCNEQGIRLIHIFEDEWLEHKEIVK